MPDVYVSIATADEAVQERLAEVLELRAAEPAQPAMLEDHLADLPLPDGARVLEVGCWTGVVARTVAARAGEPDHPASVGWGPMRNVSQEAS